MNATGILLRGPPYPGHFLPLNIDSRLGMTREVRNVLAILIGASMGEPPHLWLQCGIFSVCCIVIVVVVLYRTYVISKTAISISLDFICTCWAPHQLAGQRYCGRDVDVGRERHDTARYPIQKPQQFYCVRVLVRHGGTHQV